MTSLIVRCPMRPLQIQAENWSAEDLYFSWGFVNNVHFQKVLDLDVCPVAEQVLAIIPSIDLRLIELKIPSVTAKKISQVLPMLLEDELLSLSANTNIQLLPPFPNQLPDRRMVSVIDREWLRWLSQKLAALNCKKIQLIPESLLLPTDPSAIFYQREDQTIFYTSKRVFNEIIAWAQPESDQPLTLAESGETVERKELSLTLLLEGIATEKNIYEYVNILPNEFYAFQRNNQSELQYWFSKALWKQPLHWAGYLTLTLLISYFLYFFMLLWQDRQWQSVLQKTTNQVLAVENTTQPVFPLLAKSSCLAAHKNRETCEEDFERMLITLQELLKDFLPLTLKSLAYSKEGLTVELQEALPFEQQQLLLQKHYGLTPVDSTHYLLTPYAQLGHD